MDSSNHPNPDEKPAPRGCHTAVYSGQIGSPLFDPTELKTSACECGPSKHSINPVQIEQLSEQSTEKSKFPASVPDSSLSQPLPLSEVQPKTMCPIKESRDQKLTHHKKQPNLAECDPASFVLLLTSRLEKIKESRGKMEKLMSWVNQVSDIIFSFVSTHLPCNNRLLFSE